MCAIAGFFAFPLAIVALVLAPMARNKIAESGGVLEGESLCRTATIIAWVVLALAAVALVLFVVFSVIFAHTFNDITNHMPSAPDTTTPGVVLLLAKVGLS